MSDPIALRIIEAMKARLEAITTTPGPGIDPFHTDAGERVYLGRRTLDADEVALVIFSGLETGGDSSHPKLAAELAVHIEGQHPLANRDDGEQIGQRLIADIQRAAEIQGDRTLGGLAFRFVKYTGRALAYPPDGAALVHVRVSYSIGYHREYGAPEKTR